MEELENGKLLFHSYGALKAYCDDVNNPLDKVVLGEEIVSLSNLFNMSKRSFEQFKGIEHWNTSNVSCIKDMFYCAENFNHSIAKWDLSSVPDIDKCFDSMLYGVLLDTDLYHEIISGDPYLRDYEVPFPTLKGYEYFFLRECSAKKFNEVVNDEDIELSSLETSSITSMQNTLKDSTRKDYSGINRWFTHNVQNFNCFAKGAKNFNQSLDSFDFSVCKSISNFLEGTDFNQPLNADLSNVINASYLLADCKFYKQKNDFLHTLKEKNDSNYSGMFLGCDQLKEDDYDHFYQTNHKLATALSASLLTNTLHKRSFIKNNNNLKYVEYNHIVDKTNENFDFSATLDNKYVIVFKDKADAEMFEYFCNRVESNYSYYKALPIGTNGKNIPDKESNQGAFDAFICFHSMIERFDEYLKNNGFTDTYKHFCSMPIRDYSSLYSYAIDNDKAITWSALGLITDRAIDNINTFQSVYLNRPDNTNEITKFEEYFQQLLSDMVDYGLLNDDIMKGKSKLSLNKEKEILKKYNI